MEWAAHIFGWFGHSLRRGLGNNGNVAVVFALSLPIIVGGAGLGVETSYWYFSSLKLQAVADQDRGTLSADLCHPGDPPFVLPSRLGGVQFPPAEGWPCLTLSSKCQS
ncbi:Tad domain-containing protein [Mesorhizobium sp. M0408]